MPKLTYSEYQNLGGKAPQEEFDRLLVRAEHLLDVTSRRFYTSQEQFDADHEWRKASVKACLTFQIDYYHESGGDSYASINDGPATITLGRTSISNGGKNGGGAESIKRPLLCQDSLMALQGTGLLYRGVHHA